MTDSLNMSDTEKFKAALASGKFVSLNMSDTEKFKVALASGKFVSLAPKKGKKQ